MLIIRVIDKKTISCQFHSYKTIGISNTFLLAIQQYIETVFTDFFTQQSH